MRQPQKVLIYPIRFQSASWEYLLLHRSPHRKVCWQGVTGGVEGAESLVEAARRELQEETRMDALTIEQAPYACTIPVPDRWRHRYSDDIREVTEYTFFADVGQQAPVLDPDEHDDWRWCSYDEAIDLLLWHENKLALESCQQILLARYGSAG